MIQNRMEACRILEIPLQASQEEWKSAFRAICKQYHPDSVGTYASGRTCDYYYQAVEAYEFLEAELAKQPKKSSRVLGGPVTYRKHKENQARIQKQMERTKQQRLEETMKAARELHQKEEERRILDEIRWIRVVNIIKKAMEEDRKEKEHIKKMEEALRKRKED